MFPAHHAALALALFVLASSPDPARHRKAGCPAPRSPACWRSAASSALNCGRWRLNATPRRREPTRQGGLTTRPSMRCRMRSTAPADRVSTRPICRSSRNFRCGQARSAAFGGAGGVDAARAVSRRRRPSSTRKLNSPSPVTTRDARALGQPRRGAPGRRDGQGRQRALRAKSGRANRRDHGRSRDHPHGHGDGTP